MLVLDGMLVLARTLCLTESSAKKMQLWQGLHSHLVTWEVTKLLAAYAQIHGLCHIFGCRRDTERVKYCKKLL